LEKSSTRFSNFFALYTASGSSIDQPSKAGAHMTMTAATTATRNVTQAMQKIPLSIHIAGILLLVAVTVWCGPVSAFL
jgi:hypothetical protein